jgi:hypothetical protein
VQLPFLKKEQSAKGKYAALFWLVAVVVLSAITLTLLEDWEERKAAEVMNGQGLEATVMLIAYEGETFEGMNDADEPYIVIGCEDRLVPYEIPVISLRLKSVLAGLSAFQAPEGLHNPMQEKKLSIGSVSELPRRTTIINFAGEPILGGVCDTPRLKAQVEATIRLYEDDYELQLNGSFDEYTCIGDERGGCG